MKKRLPEGIFDTDKARKVCEWSMRSPSSNEKESYTLYKTVRRKFFVHVRGGAGSPFAERIHIGNGKVAAMGEGEDIYSVSLQEARDLVDRHGDAQSVAAAFPIQKSRKSTITLSSDAWAALDRECLRTGKKRAEIIEQLVLDNCAR